MNAAPFRSHQGSDLVRASRVQSDSSDCTVATGWIAWARSSSSTVGSESPIALPCPRRRPRPSRPRSPRSARPGRRGGAGRGRRGRCRGVAAIRRAPRACARACRRGGSPSSPGRRRTSPPFVASERLVAAALQRSPDQLLVRERPVHVGGVEQGHADLERAADHLDGLRVVAAGRVVAPGHAHAAEAERADRRAGGAESAGGDGEVAHPLTLAGASANQGLHPKRSGGNVKSVRGARLLLVGLIAMGALVVAPAQALGLPYSVKVAKKQAGPFKQEVDGPLSPSVEDYFFRVKNNGGQRRSASPSAGTPSPSATPSSGSGRARTSPTPSRAAARTSS